MLTSLYVFATALQVVLAVRICRLYQRSRSPYALIPLFVMLALITDNFIIGIGRFIGEGGTLKAINSIRFIMHALFTPWMLLFTLDIAQRAGLQWARSNRAELFWCLAMAMWALGIYPDMVQLRMEAVIHGDTLRYRNASHAGPPIPSIVVILGIKTKTPWVFVGVLIEFICAPLGFRFPIIGQFGEIAFCGTMISGEQIAQKGKRDEDSCRCFAMHRRRLGRRESGEVSAPD